MIKVLYTLIAISSHGQTYVVQKDLTLQGCAGHLALERIALLHVQAVHPDATMEFRCVEQ